jgi:hypothetical protein
MKKSEDSNSQEGLSDSIKLAIRDEVEKRVEQRESLYWKFGGLFVAIVVLFFAVLWRVSLSEVRENVEKQLAETEVVKAKDRIIAINSSAEDMNRNLIAISSSMNSNQQQFIERLNQIKRQDNVVLAEDLPNFFVVQRITNLIDGRKIVLDYEPIPETVRIPPCPFDLSQLGYVDGKTIVLTNNSGDSYFQGIANPDNLKIGIFHVEYMKKSLR